MDKIASYILLKYGYKLDYNELELIVDWYIKNEAVLKNEDILDKELRSFLVNTFPNKELHLYEEDTSNMNYLLTLLKDKTKKN